MRGSRCNGQWDGIQPFSSQGTWSQLMLGFPVVEATAMLPSLGGLSQGRLHTGLEKSRAQTECL